jgi:hypothetical protein
MVRRITLRRHTCVVSTNIEELGIAKRGETAIEQPHAWLMRLTGSISRVAPVALAAARESIALSLLRNEDFAYGAFASDGPADSGKGPGPPEPAPLTVRRGGP